MGTVVEMRLCWKLLQRPAGQALPSMALPEARAIPKPLAVNSIPSYDAVVKTRKDKINPGLLTYYKKPLYITQGSMQWLWDDKGQRYLDLFGGIVTVSVGHCHPKVNEALKAQIDTLWHTTSIYMHPKIHEYAEKLTATLPEPLKCVYFVNSGSEANDMAMMIARVYTGNFDILSFRNSYHGASPYTMGMTAHSNWKFNFANSIGTHHVMNPDPFKGLFGGSHCRDSPVQTLRSCGCPPQGKCEAADGYLNQFDETFKYSLPKGGKVAGFFAESIQGVGGSVQYPKGYLARAFNKVREHGGLCISDEVQTGFGRTGDHFWGFEGHGVIPDMVTMAKGIGNGFPLAAVVTTREIGATMARALHFNTYGGNPLASTVGMAVLDTIEEDGCQEISNQMGTHLLRGLANLRSEFEIVGDVRGKGLMIGVEMVEDKSTNTPIALEKMNQIWEDCKDMGVLVGKGGLSGNVFRIKPPMCITMEDANFFLDVFRAALLRITK